MKSGKKFLNKIWNECWTKSEKIVGENQRIPLEGVMKEKPHHNSQKKRHWVSPIKSLSSVKLFRLT